MTAPPAALAGAVTFPLRGTTKTPAVKAWQNHTTGHGTATAYGINCARTGLVVIDLDTKKTHDGPAAWTAWLDDLEREAPPTLEVATPNGDGRARHLIYRAHPTVHVPVAGNILPGVDLRAGWTDEHGAAQSAGYIVGPGSTIALDDNTGTGTYRVAADRPVADLPRWLARGLLDLIGTRTATAPGPAAPGPTRALTTDGTDPWLAGAIRGALTDLADTAALPEGATDRHGRTWETGALHARACRLVELSNTDPATYPRAQARGDYLDAAPTGHEDRFAHHWTGAEAAVGDRAASRPEKPTHGVMYEVTRNGSTESTPSGRPELAETGKTVTRALSQPVAIDDDNTGHLESTPRRVTLDECHAVFTRWLGTSYDLDALDAILAAVAVERLDGDPLWMLLVSGSGNAKTETVAPLAGAGAIVRSSISSEGALLSASPRKEKARDATGGLLRELGDHGVLVLKDFTTILSMSRDIRAAVLAALREVYDGAWTRNVGTDGGRALQWNGRIGLVGAVTTKYDAAYEVISAMGDRFALVRTDSTAMGTRSAVAHQALATLGHESDMRDELAAAVAGVIAGMNEGAALPETMVEPLVDAANLVTLARTAVERDYQGNVVSAHAPEAPTRFLKMLGQVARGILAIGGTEDHALRTALRVARDSMPPLRLLVLDAIHTTNHPMTGTQVGRKVDKPRTTVRRECDALHALGVLEIDGDEGQGAWLYRLAAGIDPTVLRTPAPARCDECGDLLDTITGHTHPACARGAA